MAAARRSRRRPRFGLSTFWSSGLLPTVTSIGSGSMRPGSRTVHGSRGCCLLPDRDFRRVCPRGTLRQRRPGGSDRSQTSHLPLRQDGERVQERRAHEDHTKDEAAESKHGRRTGVGRGLHAVRVGGRGAPFVLNLHERGHEVPSYARNILCGSLSPAEMPSPHKNKRFHTTKRGSDTKGAFFVSLKQDDQRGRRPHIPENRRQAGTRVQPK